MDAIFGRGKKQMAMEGESMEGWKGGMDRGRLTVDDVLSPEIGLQEKLGLRTFQREEKRQVSTSSGLGMTTGGTV
jgi:hypothetical protein